MLDVLHFFFEEDFSRLQSAEQAEAIDKSRDIIYSTMYNRRYKHGFGAVGSSTSQILDEDLDIGDIPTPIDPFERSRPTKPYVPPTMPGNDPSNPFSALDSPLG